MSDFYSSAGIEGLCRSLSRLLSEQVLFYFFEDRKNEGHKWIQGSQPVACEERGVVLSFQVVLLNSVSVSHPVFLPLSARSKRKELLLVLSALGSEDKMICHSPGICMKPRPHITEI